MVDDDRQAARLLKPLRLMPVGDNGSVDVRRAIRTGRRRLLLRRGGGVAACVAVLVGVVAVFTAVFAPRAQSPAAPPTGFDVAQKVFDVDTVAGFVPVSFETGRRWQSAQLIHAGGSQLTEATVTVYPQGALPWRDGRQWEPSGEQASDIDGRPALWPPASQSSPETVELAWQWGQNAWAAVTLRGPAADRDRARAVAGSVSRTAPVPVAVPFSVPQTALAEDLEMIGTVSVLGSHSQAQAFEVSYGLEDPPQPADGRIARLTVGVAPEPGPGAVTALADRQARVSDDRISFLDGSGLFVEVSGSDLRDRLGGDTGILDLASGVHLTGPDGESPSPPAVPTSPSPLPSTTTTEPTMTTDPTTSPSMTDLPTA